MSNVNYSLKHKGVRLIPAENAWKKSKKGTMVLNPKFHFVGKIDTRHFYDDNGKRNRKPVAYFGIEKTNKKGGK